MIVIEYPPYQPRIRESEGKEMIFDEVRKKWVALTPEEWVRQNFLQYLVQVKKYPSALIAVEREIKLGELSRRFDIVVYNSNHQPFIIVECKEMSVTLDQKVLDQALRYNLSLMVSCAVITNGTHTYAFSLAQGTLEQLDEIPAYK